MKPVPSPAAKGADAEHNDICAVGFSQQQLPGSVCDSQSSGRPHQNI